MTSYSQMTPHSYVASHMTSHSHLTSHDSDMMSHSHVTSHSHLTSHDAHMTSHSHLMSQLSSQLPAHLLSLPTAAAVCQVGAVAPQDPADLSIFQHFAAPSQPTPVPAWEVGVKVSLYVMSFLLSVTGNSLIIAIVCLNRRLRSTTNVLLVNQAVADLMVAAVCMWVHLGNSITPEWPFGPVVCKVNTFCQVVAVTGSVLTLTAISVDRLLAIVFPLRGPWTARTCGLVIGLTWLTAGAVASPHLMVRHLYEQRWRDRHEVWCDEDWPQVYQDASCNTWEPGKIVYYAVEGLVMYFLPVLVMVAAYTVISVRLVTRRAPGVLISGTVSAQERAKRKVIKMLVIVLTCFVLCWTPQQCMLLYDIFRPYDQVPVYVSSVKYAALYVAYLNSALNPVLYAGFNDNFRRGFRDVWRRLTSGKSNRVHPEPRGIAVLVIPRDNGQGVNGPPGHTSLTPARRDPGQTPTKTEQQTTVQTNLTTKRTAALFGDSNLDPNLEPSPTTSGCRRNSVLSDDTTHIEWRALQ